ncbi:PilN domain-containing protein [Oceanisphaera sp. W20_SRM_FM3]|uniref:PilN domain-containing protein n=1 Tax=Oceanisphaera sp. W20_SRM_FM3 TaxID=3240267 RepID=UPI003F9913EC
MSHINLLPWRSLQQAKQERRVLRQLVIVCVLSIGCVWLAGQYLQQQIQSQQLRNAQLLQASAGLDDALQQLELLRQQEQQLAVRRDFIVPLQHSRHQALQLLNHLPSWLPKGVRLDSLQLSSQALELKGQAHNYGQLADLIQRIEGIPWLSEPRLQAHSLADAAQPGTQQFSLQAQLVAVVSLPERPITTRELAKALNEEDP